MVGSFVWSLTTIKSGLAYSFGLGYWGPHGHDGIWHLSLIASLARGSWDMPIFSGSQIQNYHLGFDLLVAVLHRITSLPISWLYFQILPPVFALLIGYLVYKLIFNQTGSHPASWWSVFFVYFGGSLGWMVRGGESTFWSHQAISTLINPPFALSLILLLSLLLLLQSGRYYLAGLVLSLLPHVKIYAGLLAFGGLLVASVKNRQLLKTLLAGLVIYVPSNYSLFTQPASLVIWQPGWFLETMMGLSDRLGWTRFYSAMTTYKSSGNWLKAIPAYLMALGVFLAGNLGTRALAVAAIPRMLSHWFYLFCTAVIAAGTVVPMLFVQSGTPWNTIQFFYYVLFFAALLAGPVISSWKLKVNTTALLILLTLPTTLMALPHYLPSRPPAALPPLEMEALGFLAAQPLGVVLTPPADPDPYAPAPRPLYLYESTAYVSAYANKPSFLEDEVNLDITGYDWPARRQAVEAFFATPDAQSGRQFLAQNNIRYLYLPQVASVRPVLSETALGLVKLFENSQVAIWGRE